MKFLLLVCFLVSCSIKPEFKSLVYETSCRSTNTEPTSDEKLHYRTLALAQCKELGFPYMDAAGVTHTDACTTGGFNHSFRFLCYRKP